MKLFKWFFSLFSKKYQKPLVILAKYCKHETELSGEVRAFGEDTTTSMPRNAGGTTDWCLGCIGKMAIRCGWCEKPIFIGDPITLYTPAEDTFVLPKDAALNQNDASQVVGCLRCNCAESGADRAGFWVPGNNSKGRVRRVVSPLELAMESEGSAVIINDLRDPTEAQDISIEKVGRERA